MIIKITNDIIDPVKDSKPLKREVYEFWVRSSNYDSDLKIILDKYFFESRENSRQRKWKKEKAYCRLSHELRDSFCEKLTFDEVPLNNDIEEAVKVNLIMHIKDLPISEKS